METQERHLYYLWELSDYTIDHGYPDIRNWPVKDSVLRIIGMVKSLLVNKNTEKVVYLDVEVDGSIIDVKHDPYGISSNMNIREFINTEGENHIIIPIGLVSINREGEFVYTDSIDYNTFAETKRKHSNAPIEREYETTVLGSYGRRYSYKPLDKRVDSDIENTKVGSKGRRRTDEPVIGEQMDLDIENMEIDEKIRMEKIKQRHKVGEYGDEEPISEVDWYDAGSGTLKSLEEIEDDFYNRKEFDDAKFRRNKK